MKSQRRGKATHPIYGVWIDMRQRCYNPNNLYYHRYGGRGIKVCDRWQGVEGFDHFLADMGLRPAKGYSIGRIDNNGDYEPSNCRWETSVQQNRNTSNNRMVTYKGKTQTVTEWSLEVGLNRITVLARLDRGLSVEKALTMLPIKTGRPLGSRDRPKEGINK